MITVFDKDATVETIVQRAIGRLKCLVSKFRSELDIGVTDDVITTEVCRLSNDSHKITIEICSYQEGYSDQPFTVWLRYSFRNRRIENEDDECGPRIASGCHNTLIGEGNDTHCRFLADNIAKTLSHTMMREEC